MLKESMLVRDDNFHEAKECRDHRMSKSNFKTWFKL